MRSASYVVNTIVRGHTSQVKPHPSIRQSKHSSIYYPDAQSTPHLTAICTSIGKAAYKAPAWHPLPPNILAISGIIRMSESNRQAHPSSTIVDTMTTETSRLSITWYCRTTPNMFSISYGVLFRMSSAVSPPKTSAILATNPPSSRQLPSSDNCSVLDATAAPSRYVNPRKNKINARCSASPRRVTIPVSNTTRTTPGSCSC